MTMTNAATAATAFALASEGRSTEQIAAALGFSNRQAAYRAVRQHAAANGVDMPTRRVRRSTRSAAPRSARARRFGVEIEVVGIDEATAARAIEAAGIRCANGGYNHRQSSSAVASTGPPT